MRISDWSSDVCSSDLSTLRSDDRQCDGRICADVIRGREWSRCARCGGGSRQSPENHAVRIWASVAALLVVLMASSPTVAQMTVEEARQEGRVLGNEKRQDSTLVPTDSARAEAVPGYGGTSLPQGAYFDNPERMEAEATEIGRAHV